MARWLTVLFAMVAQGMALMGSVCLVRCVAANGHECVELVGQDCHCCDFVSQKRSPEMCQATCGHHHEEEHHDEHDVPVGWQVRCEHCTCQHSLLESAPQVQSKSLASDEVSQSQVFVPAPMTLNLVAVLQALENASLQRSLLRPHVSPHLAVVATVVLRV